jgi:type IV secretory pathway VirB3-like protein
MQTFCASTSLGEGQGFPLHNLRFTGCTIVQHAQRMPLQLLGLETLVVLVCSVLQEQYIILCVVKPVHVSIRMCKGGALNAL